MEAAQGGSHDHVPEAGAHVAGAFLTPLTDEVVQAADIVETMGCDAHVAELLDSLPPHANPRTTHHG